MRAERLATVLALLGAVLVGVLTATQARINGALGASIGMPLMAAFVSFSSGLVIVAVWTFLAPSARVALATLRREAFHGIPAWMLLGGCAGAFTVATQTLTVATIGVALFTVGVVAGQTVHGLVLDRLGHGPAGVVAVTVPRLVGAMLAIGGVIVAMAGEGVSGVPPWMLLLPFLAGAGIAWQQATNGRLRQRVQSALVATLVNFTGGTLALGIALGVQIFASGSPAQWPGSPWLYLGGALGVAYIFLSAALVRLTGVLLLGLGSVVGLLTSSVALDALWPPQAGPPLVRAALAAVVALAGVAVVVVPWRRRSLRRQ